MAGNDDINRQMGRLNALTLGGNPGQIRQQKFPKKPHDRKKLIVFENSQSLNDRIKFFKFNQIPQPSHANHNAQNAVKTVGLQNPYQKSMNSFDRLLFNEKVNEELSILNILSEEFLNKNTNKLNVFDSNVKLSIQLGYEYFCSKLFIWDTPLTIMDLEKLMRHEILNTDRRFYRNPRNDFGNPRNPHFETLQGVFTEKSTISNPENFKRYLAAETNFKEVETIVKYKVVLKKSNHNFIGKLFNKMRNDINNDDYLHVIIDKIASADKLEVEFDDRFKLRKVIFLESEENYRHMKSIDLIRTSDNDKCANGEARASHTVNKFDVRFKFQDKSEITSRAYEDFRNLQKVFDGFLSETDDGTCLVVNSSPDNVEFVRKDKIKKFIQNESENEIVLMELRLSDFIEYSVREGTIYKPNVFVANFIDINVKLNDLLVRIFDNKKDNEANNRNESDEISNKFVDKIWDTAIWLSNVASNLL